MAVAEGEPAIMASAGTDGIPRLTRSIRNDAYVRRLELTLAAHSVGP
jgi:hypothetical protein